jgi:hypothetical protein
MSLTDTLEQIRGNLNGRLLSDDEERELRAKLGTSFPDWLGSLMKSYPLIGVQFTLSEEEDLSGLGGDLKWLAPDAIVEEATELEPGKTLGKGFLPVAECMFGSGDPYFLDLRSVEMDDPAFVRAPHEAAAGGTYDLENLEVVSSSLSEFFSKASTY